ncbi:hypothetical protein ACVBEJ_14375 [Porticoccus sp. GXU_MW_L64]
MKTVIEEYIHLTGGPRKRATEVDAYWGLVWAEETAYQLGISLDEFEKDYLRNVPDETYSPIKKWKTGNRGASNLIVNRALSRIKDDKIKESSKLLFQFPLKELLADKSVSKRKTRELIKPYSIREEKNGAWLFPNDHLEDIPADVMQRLFDGSYSYRLPDLPYWYYPNDGRWNGRWPLKPCVLLRGHSEALFERGDIFGFMSLLCMVREAENNKDVEAHSEHMANCYRAFPAIARLRPFRKRWPTLLNLLEMVHLRSHCSYFIVQPNVSVIKQQVLAEYHIPEREARFRDQDGCFEEIEDTAQYTDFPITARKDDPVLEIDDS